MPAFKNRIHLSKRTSFSLVITAFLLGAIVLTQIATLNIRDNRSQAATCNYSGSFQFTEPTSISPLWTGWNGTYDVYVYKQNLSRSASNPANCGVNPFNIGSNGAGYTWTFNLPSTLQCGTMYTGDVALHGTSIAVSWIKSFATAACPAAPTASISAANPSIPYNGSTTITWSSNNATSCSVTGTSSTATGGSFNTGALTTNRTYYATCTGAGGNSPQVSAPVTVGAAPPTASISAANPSIAYNTSTTITWSSTNATSCSVTGTSSTAIGGSFNTGNLTTPKIYYAQCSGAGGNSPQVSAPVTVGAAPPSGGGGGGGTPSKPPVVTAPKPSGPKVTPPGQAPSQTAGVNDITLNFDPNPYLQGGMEITATIDTTSVSQKIVLEKTGGTFIMKTSGLTKNVVYKLRASSKNSLVNAYTFTFTNSTSVKIGPFLTGDFNKDNSINDIDLNKLLSNGMSSQDSLYDINYDGVVNSIDYSLLLINLGKNGQ